MMEFILNRFPPFVLLFAFFSVCGWMMEVVLKYIELHRFVNRGYLIGPYCPIYGWGVLLITLLAGGVIFRKCTVLETFMVGFFVCGGLEYAVSWMMEKFSHARWWDYSQKPMNLNGRVWIGNLLLFGLAAVAVVYGANPILFGILEKIPIRTQQIISAVFLVLIWVDRVISQTLLSLVRTHVEHHAADDTEEIRQVIRQFLRENMLLRRVVEAYPDWQPRPSGLMKRLQEARNEYREANRHLQALLREARQERKEHYEQAAKRFSEEIGEKVLAAQKRRNAAREKLHEIECRLLK